MGKWQYTDGRTETVPDVLDDMLERDPAYTKVGDKPAQQRATTADQTKKETNK